MDALPISSTKIDKSFPGTPQVSSPSGAASALIVEAPVGQIVTPTLSIPGDFHIHVAQYRPTDRPIEDRFSLDFDAEKTRLILGVYDGHGGPETADHISKVLPPLLLERSPSEHAQIFEELDHSILLKFKQDHLFLRRKSFDWIHNAQLVKSGSTALVIDIDLQSLSATYANAGDCRLVVCDLNSGRLDPLLQTNDLNMKTSLERDRLVYEHPNEDQIIVGDRLFGRLMCTRGFGDGYYKLPRGLFGNSQHRKYIDTLSAIERPGKIPMNKQYASLFYGYKTPPYITATPETGTYQLEKGNIVILATDGLWDLISSEEATRILLQGVAECEDNLPCYLLENIKAKTSPGDDITVIVFKI
ncbi:hypothetical protein GALMADRAFT_96092 [Galerina marginata CBS 339.88]|uniref:PPM-type phosphatase domain-containing protein n=1 Tax=Galerina marginata (strain CBS 339.88) TaxID=685588 RepID=A0A067TBP2_GALM3|nr:hypothetical protein GALMADRAFT_96092 [Galerina marginata CBS 339.88]